MTRRFEGDKGGVRVTSHKGLCGVSHLPEAVGAFRASIVIGRCLPYLTYPRYLQYVRQTTGWHSRLPLQEQDAVYYVGEAGACLTLLVIRGWWWW